MKDYRYGSEFHIDLAVEAMKRLLSNHELFNASLRMSTVDRASHLAAESFAIAEAMITQIKSL